MRTNVGDWAGLIASRGSATLILLLLLITAGHTSAQSVAAQGSASVGVWNDTCHSWNITLTNPLCGSLAVGSRFSVEVNATNAPTFNAYEFSLYFDSHFLQWNHTDTMTGTIFSNPFTVKDELPVPGTYSLAVVDPGGTNSASSGILAHVYFKILAIGVSPLVLGAGMAEPSPYAQDGSWTRLAMGSTPLGVVTTNGYFKNEPLKVGPVASLMLSPTLPILGQSVSFDATNSFDPDNRTRTGGIRHYLWDFGDRYTIDTPSPIVTHAFNFPGNFSVGLTVFDFDDGFQGMLTMRIEIGVHDLAVKLDAYPRITPIGTPVSVNVSVSNVGTFPETFDLKVGYKPPGATIGSLTGVTLHPSQSSSFNFTLPTSIISPGQYDIVANLTDPLDQNPGNNAATVHITVLSNLFPVASFSYLPANPSVGEIVYFNGSSSHGPNGAIVQWNWTWGDGLIQSYGPPTTWHIYLEAGVYTVSLSVADVTGNTASTEATLTVVALAGEVPHSPIIINGNNGFNASSGVRRGTGIASDPYVIEGWQIDSSNVNGITISNTNVYFIVRNVVVTSTVSSNNNVLGYVGIRLIEVANGQIEASAVVTEASAFPRVSITNSERVRVSNNEIFGDSIGISCRNSNNITINDNTLSHDSFGIWLESSTNVSISGNMVSSVVQDGLFLVQSSEVSVFANDFSQNGDGIRVEGGAHVSITGNNITSNLYDGIVLEPTVRFPIFLTKFVTISNNIISKNGFSPLLQFSGIHLSYGSQNVTIFGNDFLNNRIQASQWGTGSAYDNSWDNGYPGGGNYWSDYHGIDKCAGPGQNICTSSDGVGDSPYNITDGLIGIMTNTGTDHYPLMRPATLGPDRVPPSWSSGTQLTTSKLSQTGLVLAWSPASDDNRVVRYRVYDGSTLLSTLPGYLYNYNVTGLSPGTSYTFKIEAGDVANNWSTTGPLTSVTTLAPPGSSSTPPGSPAGPQPTAFWQQYWWPVAVAVVLTVATTAVTLLRRQRGPRSKTPA